MSESPYILRKNKVGLVGLLHASRLSSDSLLVMAPTKSRYALENRRIGEIKESSSRHDRLPGGPQSRRLLSPKHPLGRNMNQRIFASCYMIFCDSAAVDPYQDPGGARLIIRLFTSALESRRSQTQEVRSFVELDFRCKV